MREISRLLDSHVGSVPTKNFREVYKLNLPEVDGFVDFSHLPESDDQGVSTLIIGQNRDNIGLNLKLNFTANGVITNPDAARIRSPFSVMTINNSHAGVIIRNPEQNTSIELFPHESEIVLSSLCGYLSSIKTND